ncbi:MAG: hypothetical protein IJP68_06710 [Selenomonadaceae bacterium]|nr:hypothetical protein [Selenomonadaceae bacterium]
MKNVENCKLLVNELIDINVRQREIVRKIGNYVAQDGGNEHLMSALKNYLEKIDDLENAGRELYIVVENLFVDDVLNHAKHK